MRPYNKIKIGDMYYRGYPYNIVWTVVDKDDDSHIIEIMSDYQHPALSKTLWKKCTDSIFIRKLND